MPVMAPNALSALTIIASAYYVAAQTIQFPPSSSILINVNYPAPSDAPYQVYPPTGVQYTRGPQSGYNICNSTTEGSSSLCQTSYVNSLSDFCLWAPPTPNTSISDSEGEEVAWCTQPGHGTRVIPAGTILGAQLLKSNDYLMITGNIAQTNINMQDGDYGGELDSGGQDERGNPIGGLMYSTAYASSESQIHWWTEFIGSNQFCIKICNPSGSNNAGYCQHTLDRIGLAYNCPSKYTIDGGFQNGEFEVCETADMTVPGIYVGPDGKTTSYAQPAETVDITSMPYTVTAAVASSSCTTYASTDVFSIMVSSAVGVSATSSASVSTGSSAASSSPAASSGSVTSLSSASSTVVVTASVNPSASGSSSSTSSAPSASGNGALSISFSLTGAFAAAAVAILA